MVRPTTFGFDEQTAKTNSFQHQISLTQQQVRRQANNEFDAEVAALRAAGVEVLVFTDSDDQSKPDAVFPNNWLSTWPDGQMYLYPMNTSSRRIERSQDALDLVRRHFVVNRITDISGAEMQGRYLEGTGAIVFDHAHKVAYGCISPRCDKTLFQTHVRQLGYEPVLFHAYDIQGMPIYHTNVVMGVQRATAVLCSQAITDVKERQFVIGKLTQTGHQLVEITQKQMAGFCGNVLELANGQGQHFLALSQTANNTFTPQQRRVLAQDKKLLSMAIPTIETVGGGSIRCTLAELFLPPRQHDSGIYQSI